MSVLNHVTPEPEVEKEREIVEKRNNFSVTTFPSGCSIRVTTHQDSDEANRPGDFIRISVNESSLIIHAENKLETRLPIGTYDVAVSKLGFERGFQVVRIEDDQITVINIALTPIQNVPNQQPVEKTVTDDELRKIYEASRTATTKRRKLIRRIDTIPAQISTQTTRASEPKYAPGLPFEQQVRRNADATKDSSNPNTTLSPWLLFLLFVFGLLVIGLAAMPFVLR